MMLILKRQESRKMNCEMGTGGDGREVRADENTLCVSVCVVSVKCQNEMTNIY